MKHYFDMDITDIKDMLDECQQMQTYLEQKVSDDPNHLSERIQTLCVYMARSGNMLADAKYIQDLERRRIYNESLKMIQKMPATVSAKFVECMNSEANYLVNWLDRINRTCVHHIDGYRTIFSYVKENLKLTRGGY